jgi:dihydroorotate dehydrogenase electron transfer subunit
MKDKQNARIRSARELAPGIHEMWIETSLAKEAHPGQFIGVYTKDASKLLPRPISICEVAPDALRIVYRVTGPGTGTELIARMQAGENVEILGILGNGYDLNTAKGREVFVIGGGIGVPPMLELARSLHEQNKTLPEADRARIQIVVGYRDGNLFLKEDLEKYGEVTIATEDGSVGTKGNVLDAIREKGLHADILYSCGPLPMLRALKNYAEEQKIPAYISLEERMACGVGACLGCVVKTPHVDHHSHVNNARICTDGPVFNAEEVEI